MSKKQLSGLAKVLVFLSDILTSPAITSANVTIGVTALTKKYTRTLGTSFITEGFLSGDVVLIAGFVDGDSNGLKTIDTVASTYFTVVEAVGVNEGGTGDELVILSAREVSTAHGLNKTPALAFVTINSTVAEEHFTVTPGTHDAINCKFTVTPGLLYQVVAVA